MSRPAKVPSEAYDQIADQLNCSPALVRALSVVESAERPDAIRFESHWWRKTRFASREAKTFDRSRNPRSWEDRWHKFHQMDAVCREDRFLNRKAEFAAILSHSFGFCQIMGFNHRHCGFENARNWYEAMLEMDGQVMCFIAFVKDSRSLLSAFQSTDLLAIAREYNGPKHKRYDRKLANAMGGSQYA